MAATVSGALKAYLETQSLGMPIYRERANEGQLPPFVTITDGISIVPEPHGDYADPANRRSVTEQVQVSLWQRWRAASGALGENFLLPDKLADILSYAKLPNAPTVVMGVVVGQTVRITEYNTNIVQYATTLTIRRERLPR